MLANFNCLITKYYFYWPIRVTPSHWVTSTVLSRKFTSKNHFLPNNKNQEVNRKVLNVLYEEMQVCYNKIRYLDFRKLNINQSNLVSWIFYEKLIHFVPVCFVS